jgi:L-asparagine oxygenase
LCLACLRNPDKTHTRLSPLDNVLSKMQPEDIEELEKCQFTIECQNTFAKGTQSIIGEKHYAYDAEILRRGSNNQYMVRYSHSKAVADHDNEAACKALANFQNAIKDSILGVQLDPGDVLILNNRRALHGRGEQTQDYGGHTRWLLRGYGLFNHNIDADFFYDNSAFKLYP